MKTKHNTMTDLYDAIHSDICDKLDDGIGSDGYDCDLLHQLCNSDYFIIGTYQAKEFLGAHAFEVINKIKNYEQNNFGECYTDLSDPERVVNMFAYIVGEEILAESETLFAVDGGMFTEDEFKAVKMDIASLNITKVYNTNN